MPLKGFDKTKFSLKKTLVYGSAKDSEKDSER
jgi:hypothetical protein